MGRGAALASVPTATTPRGGLEDPPTGFSGSDQKIAGSIQPKGAAPDAGPFAGLGPLLEQPDDGIVFRTLHDLCLRQLRLFRNHLAQDTHWRTVKLGYPWSTLDYDAKQDEYRCRLPRGVTRTSIEAVPNLTWDQIRKAKATLLADFPKPRTQPIDASAEAEGAAQMATRFLNQDGGPLGTDDARVFQMQTEAAMTGATAYNRYWTDPSGGGSVPLQIQAHPQAVSPAAPFTLEDGSEGTPADAVMRYVTAADETARFTEDPSQAAPMWVPQIRIDQMGREHVRVFPESEPVEKADQVLTIWYRTIAEGKRCWPETVGHMEPDQLAQLTGWTPPEYLAMLPPQLRARWRMQAADPQQQSGSDDQRLFFFYTLYQRPRPDYPVGAVIDSTGAFGGLTLGKETLAAASADGASHPQARRTMTIPVVGITPVPDPDRGDPTGVAYASLFGGAAEFATILASNYVEHQDLVLHSEAYSTSTSPISGQKRKDARETGDIIRVTTKDDLPVYPAQPPFPQGVWGSYEAIVTQVQSMASLPKPLVGADRQQEVSGKSRMIAVQQGQIGLGPMLSPVNAAVARHYRIKLQLAQRFPVPVLIGYVGEDGAYRRDQFEARNFALIGDVDILPNTGTMMTPDAKVEYVASAKNGGLMDAEEAQAVARQVFGDTLGLGADPHEERAQRQLAAWQEGPPAAAWQAYEAAAQQAQAAAQQARAMGQPAPQMPLPPLPDPFEPRPNDAEPAVAGTFLRVLSRAMSSTAFSAKPPAWQALLVRRYQAALQAVTAMQESGIIGGVPGAETYQALMQQVLRTVIHDVAGNLGKLITAGVGAPAAPDTPPTPGPAPAAPLGGPTGG